MSPEASERSLASSGTHASLADSIRRLRRRAKARATPHNILLFLVAFRILNALAVRTFFQPDEFFQSLEPAWQVVFGKDSGAWITWVSFFLKSSRETNRKRCAGMETRTTILYPPPILRRRILYCRLFRMGCATVPLDCSRIAYCSAQNCAIYYCGDWRLLHMEIVQQDLWD